MLFAFLPEGFPLRGRRGRFTLALSASPPPSPPWHAVGSESDPRCAGEEPAILPGCYRIQPLVADVVTISRPAWILIIFIIYNSDCNFALACGSRLLSAYITNQGYAMDYTSNAPAPSNLDDMWVVLLIDPSGDTSSPWSVRARSRPEAIREAIKLWHEWASDEDEEPLPSPDVEKVYERSWISNIVECSIYRHATHYRCPPSCGDG